MAKIADLLIIGAAELLTVENPEKSSKTCGEMNDLGIIKDGALAIALGRIVDIGSTEQILDEWSTKNNDRFIVNASGKIAMPGFVDCHTHLVFGGSREEEFALKIQGAGYTEILKAGGGILKTVQDTRVSQLNLTLGAWHRLNEFLKCGTTSLEAKSGYGLCFKKELEILTILNNLVFLHNIADIVPTFLGAHAFPSGKSRDSYLEEIFEMIQSPSFQRLANYCDVFCDDVAFSLGETEAILREARERGMKLKLHAGQFSDIGAVELGVECGCASLDHLEHISDAGISMMAETKTIGVLLPVASLHLMKNEYAPARKMIEAGVPVALATDFNPGSAPVFSMKAVIELACRQLKMTPAEAITAATINAAHAIGLADKVGSLEIGKQADIIILNVPNHLQVPYWFGGNPVETVIKKGKIVVKN